MGKRNQVNVYAKREEELANALLNAGKPKEETIEDKTVENVEEVKNELAVEKTNVETEIKPVETKQETVKETVVEEPVEVKQEVVKPVKEENQQTQQDLFTIKKKVKMTKRQKNLNLKEDNIEALVNFARKNDFTEGEVIDHLIENYLKLIKIR